MPTGYTAGIVDGRTRTFRQFAMLCMRAFGACIHLRDTNLSTKYTPAKVDRYHLNEIAVIEHSLAKLKKMSDQTLIKREKQLLQEEIDRYTKSIENTKKVVKRLLAMKKKVQDWTPPTSQHTEFKKFMLKQLNLTIDFDGRTSYAVAELQRLNFQIANLDPVAIRKAKEEQFKKDLKYHTKEYEEEVKRVAGRNKWVQDLLNSIK
jgi:hypothetical protein